MQYYYSDAIKDLRSIIMLKVLLIARDRPNLFFILAVPSLTALAVLEALLFAYLFNQYLEPNNVSDGTVLLVIVLVFLPLAPPFFLISFLFAEYYFYLIKKLFRMLGIPWPIGPDKRKMAQSMIDWLANSGDSTRRSNN